ncbi:hypothetical protein NX059_002306 [Plenodomus lindquistii]|nr:hypothetical protein NX059_002306 [Plenodomus lindquistii]
MVRLLLSTPLPPAPSTLTIDVAPEKPFPFLRLPKDIRFMVYEQLPITTNKHQIPMSNPAHHITLVNPSITGIRILATCRQINEEASYILKPHLTRMLKTPPEIQIEAKHLIGVINLKEKFFPKIDILDRIFAAVRSSSTLLSIFEYRVLGDQAFMNMEFGLRTRGLLDEHDYESITAVATFVLRAYQYAKTYPSTFYACPPITITVNVPQTYQRQIVTSTVSRPMRLYHRVVLKVQLQRSRTGMTQLDWLFCRLAFFLSLKCDMYESLGVCIKMRHTCVEHGKSEPVPQATEHKIHAMIMRGIYDAGGNGKGLVYYGGVVQDGDQDVEIAR